MNEPDADLAAFLDEEHAAEIDEHRAELNEQIATALSALSAAEHRIAILMSDRVYDLDVAEGPDGQDIASHLGDAARSVRAARAVFRYATTPAIAPAKRSTGGAV